MLRTTDRTSTGERSTRRAPRRPLGHLAITRRCSSSVRNLVDAFTTGSSEAALADVLTDYRTLADETGSGRRSFPAFAVRNPGRTALAIVAVLRLPRFTAVLDDTGEGSYVRAVLDRRHLGRVPVGATGLAALRIPDPVGEYVAGAHRQTLRRKVRAAQKRGITIRAVPGSAEREALLRSAVEAEKAHPDVRYRIADPDLRDLLHYDLWLLAVDRSERPLMLAVIPHAGGWAVLRYFRTLGSGPDHSDSRYLMAVAVVDELHARDVRVLADQVPAAHLSNGLRHFQRMIGFRYVRIRLRRN